MRCTLFIKPTCSTHHLPKIRQDQGLKRNLAFYFVFELLGGSLFEIGFLFGRPKTGFLGVVPAPHWQHPQTGQSALILIMIILVAG